MDPSPPLIPAKRMRTKWWKDSQPRKRESRGRLLGFFDVSPWSPLSRGRAPLARVAASMAGMMGVARGRRVLADRHHRELDVDLAGTLEDERTGHGIAMLQRLREYRKLDELS